MDAGGLRASLDGMMQRIADGGYVVAGLTGYCMGGNVVLRAAAIFGERIAAVASFHSAGLATDAPDSPHLGAAKIRTEVLVVGAIEDPTLTAEMRERLRAALQAAGVVHTVTTYPGRHGFAVPGVSAYDRECSERHFAELGALLARRLSTATP
jgi:carboxymethylenebutenolidase